MNFNILKIFMFLTLLTLISCGVKTPPLQHPDTIVDSYVGTYTGTSSSLPAIEPEQDANAIKIQK